MDPLDPGAAWYLATGALAAVIAAQARRGRYAPAWIVAMVTIGCALLGGFVPLLPAIASLTGVGAALERRRTTRRTELLSAVLGAGPRGAFLPGRGGELRALVRAGLLRSAPAETVPERGGRPRWRYWIARGSTR